MPTLKSADLGLARSSTLADRTVEYAFEQLSPAVMGHCARSFILVRPAAVAQGLEPGRDFDEEVVFFACLLHRLGAGTGGVRFEIEGADLAKAFLLGQGLEPERAEAVWTAIILHTAEGIAQRFSPEAGLAQLVIATDIGGSSYDGSPSGTTYRASADWPRLDTGEEVAPGGSSIWSSSAVDTEQGEFSPRRGRGEWPVAASPEQLGQLFVKHLGARDLGGLLSLYEASGVVGPAPGSTATGLDAIRVVMEALVASGAKVDLTPRSAILGSGIALISHTSATTSREGAVTVVDTTEIARRQTDGRWLYAIHAPFFTVAQQPQSVREASWA